MNKASAIRAAIRAAVVCATAFGLKLSAEQVAAIQLAAEAGLQVVTAYTSKAGND